MKKKAVYTRLTCAFCNWVKINEYPFEMKDEEILPKDQGIISNHLKSEHEIDDKLQLQHISHERIKLK